MKNVLIWLSSARTDALELSPGDRPKHLGIGSAIVLTGTIAGVAMSYALASAVKAPAVAAVAFGVAWAVGIMLLDRWLVASIQRGSRVQNILTALPRLALAVLFGVVISTPLVLRIFEPEIAAEITRIQQADADAFQRQQREGDAGKAIADLTAQRDALQKTITTGGDVPTDPEADPKIVSLRSQLKEAEKARDAAVKKLDCQLYGPCKPTGPGPLAEAARRELNVAEGRIRTINGQIEERKRELSANDKASRDQRVADAKAALPDVQRRLEERIRQQEALRREFEERQRNSSGLLARIEALDRLSERDSAMQRAHLLLILLFTAIEILPVLVKLLMLFAPESNYERIVREQENEELHRARLKIHTGGSGEPLLDEDLQRIWGKIPEPPDPAEEKPARTTPLPDGMEPSRGGTGPDPGDARRLREMPDANVRGYGAFDDDAEGWSDATTPGGRSGGAASDGWDEEWTDESVPGGRSGGAASDDWDEEWTDEPVPGRRPAGAAGWDGGDEGTAAPPRSFANDDFAGPRATTAFDPGRRTGSPSARDDETDRLLEFDD